VSHSKKIIVTGGAGYIGSHASKALARAGYIPVVLDNFERGHRWAVKWGPLVQADLRNQEDLCRALETWRPCAVMHFAAYAYVGESSVKPLDYYYNNIGGTANLLSACARVDCKNVVFSSSCATYGIPDCLPVTEDHPQRPVNPYGYSKLVVENMLKHAEAAHGIRHVVLRYFNAAGADPESELGEMHDPETHLIPLVLLAATGRHPSVQIFGTDYPTPDGSCIRDYVHVSDLADAHVAALDWLLGGHPSGSFNLGTGRGFSVRDVIRTTEEITGRPIKTEICPRRAGDPPILISDASRARDQLGWIPRFPSLDQQIEHAWKWMREEMPKVLRS
jgi:UDP-arabinose 4-epimerase